jgi:hypothetical protein
VAKINGGGVYHAGINDDSRPGEMHRLLTDYILMPALETPHAARWRSAPGAMNLPRIS